MTSTYDPHDPGYVDEAACRTELTRVFDVCAGCRRCVDRCGSFPLLFGLIDRHPDRDAGRLTPAQQDAVVDECFGCQRCLLGCPYAPGRDPAAVDVPAALTRAVAMRRASGHLPWRARAGAGLVGGAGLVARLGGALPSIGNALVGAPGSPARRALRAVTGASARRPLPRFAEVRFSTWFAKRPETRLAEPHDAVAVVATCLVERHAPEIGRDLVNVYERNGIGCHIAEVECCGAPLLRNGDVDGFTRTARTGVRALAAQIRDGRDIAVAQPTCSLTIRRDWPAYAAGSDAELVAGHTFDACEYLVRQRAGDGTLDTDFDGEVPASIAYHVSCHLRAQDIGLAGRDLLELTGARVVLAEGCSGGNGAWTAGDAGEERAAGLAEEITAAGVVVIAGDCHLAGVAIGEHTGVAVRHPLQVLARAYGVAEDG